MFIQKKKVGIGVWRRELRLKLSEGLYFVILCFVVIYATGCSGNLAQYRKPLIGITTVPSCDSEGKIYSVAVSYNYVEAVKENGGCPVLLPALKDRATIMEYINSLDGLVLAGGADIPPAVYGEKQHATVQVMSMARFDFESQLIPYWLESGKPILGICLGMQFVNVLSGGTMIQDIPSEVGGEVIHRSSNAYHDISIDPDSRLARILGKRNEMVYSNHHQAIDDIGDGLSSIAHSPDGVVEALERTDGNYGLFVQWHPEAMGNNAEHRDAIFRDFVLNCQN